nr:sigma-70 family RNA polymerase sigma factor [Flavobacterium agri]
MIKRARDGDSSAWNALIDHHKELAFSIALRYLKNRDDALDVVQDAFVLAFRYISGFRDEAKFSTWLYKIVYHECLRMLKKRKTTTEFESGWLDSESSDEDEIAQETDISALMQKLNPNEYLIIQLFYLEEKSINDISEITGFSKSNIKVMLHRSREKMRISAQDPTL